MIQVLSVQFVLYTLMQMTANVSAEVRVYRKYYRDVVAIVRKVGNQCL